MPCGLYLLGLNLAGAENLTEVPLRALKGVKVSRKYVAMLAVALLLVVSFWVAITWLRARAILLCL